MSSAASTKKARGCRAQQSAPTFSSPSSRAICSKSWSWLIKKPYFFWLFRAISRCAMRLGRGYLVKAAKVAWVNFNPYCLDTSMRNPCALPSKLVKSAHWSLRTCCIQAFPEGCSLKKSEMASSPACPKGGFPISCVSAAAATMEPIPAAVIPLEASLGYFSSKISPAALPKDRPTEDTSKLCVNRVCTKACSGRGKTWVLSWRFRKGAEKIIRS